MVYIDDDVLPYHNYFHEGNSMATTQGSYLGSEESNMMATGSADWEDITIAQTTPRGILSQEWRTASMRTSPAQTTPTQTHQNDKSTGFGKGNLKEK